MSQASRLRILGSSRRLQVRWYSVKPLYVTSPIFYVNAKPHLGHAYTTLLCDARARWEILHPSRKAYFLTGTDEHGLKIQAAAGKACCDPQQFVDDVSQNFKMLDSLLNARYDRFIRTTDEDHVQVVQYFWKLMMDKGLIYKGSHSGWYSVSDETFYPESQIEEIVNSEGHRLMISKETRTQVIFQQETNYFFRMAQFQSELIEFLERKPNFIYPLSRQRDLLNELRTSKLTDLSVSRPSSRLSWSIEVPGDPSQKIYVWFDALLNYLTAAGFPASFGSAGSSFKTPPGNIWPAIHVVGKDIVKFHCVYWPIFLMAAGVELPRHVIVHSHWLSEGVKMSKSLGNVVDPISTLDYYGEDAFRFYLAEYSNLEHDCNFIESSFAATRDKLVSKYANLVSRVGGTNFNIKQLVEFWREGKFADIQTRLSPESSSVCEKLVKDLDNLYTTMDSSVNQFEFKRAIQAWWEVIERANDMFQKTEPWTLTKKIKSAKSESDKEHYQLLQNHSVFLAAEAARITSILIGPIIPGLSRKILDRLGVDTSRRTTNYAKIGSDTHFGADANDKGHPLPIERIQPRPTL